MHKFQIQKHQTIMVDKLSKFDAEMVIIEILFKLIFLPHDKYINYIMAIIDQIIVKGIIGQHWQVLLVSHEKIVISGGKLVPIALTRMWM